MSARGRPVLPNTRLPDFVKWSESDIGFYPGTMYRNGSWFPSDKPIKWEPHQARLFSWAMAVNSKGKLPIDTLFYIDVAKSGKTMLGAAMAQYFGTYVDRGIPGEIIIAANAQHQAQVRTFGTLKKALLKHPYIDDIVDGGVNGIADAGIRFKQTGHVCRNVPTKSTTIAGSDAVLLDFDEVHGLTGEAAKQFVSEMKPSFTRNISFRLMHSYPGYHGDDGFLTNALADFYDEEGQPTPQAQKVEGLEDLPLLVIGRTALWWNHNPHLYRWITRETMEEVHLQYKHLPKEIRRIYYAELTQSADSFVPVEVWNRTIDPEWGGAQRERGKREVMVGGLDLAAVHDTSGVVWRGFDPETNKLPLMAHKVWKPKDYRGEITGYLLNEVKQHILDMHRQYNVVAVYYDQSQAIYMVNELIKAGVNMVEVGQVKDREIADTSYRQLIYDARLRNYLACGELTEHVLNARAKITGDMTMRITKDRTAKPNDLAVADSMACYGVELEKAKLTRLARRGPSRPILPKRDVFAEMFRMGNRHG